MSEYKFYTVTEIAEILQVHWQSVLNYIKSGKLKAVKLGKGYRISSTALSNFISDSTVRKNNDKK